ncbi:MULTISPECIES: superoxide dismutase [Bacillus]|uniref:superoxide dismutase n=1 Tax=Bacillus TaxID=1386 RepID=UPI00285B962B|nr:superoxide dismutase [Bacillus pumilus]MDR6747683.1 Fe-Mn family superoxide dismutase [Bacillus pumilus]
MNKEEYRMQLKDWLSFIQGAVQDDNTRQKAEHLSFIMNDEHSSEEEWYELAESIAEDIIPQDAMRDVAVGGHQLPPLPYRYDALEPFISKEVMYLHHQKHHQSYVDGLNQAELALKRARRTNDFKMIKHWERELAFNGAGHYLHCIFWFSMSPSGKRKPTGQMLRLIEQSFESYDAFKSQFSAAAKQVEGVGWAILVWAPRSQRLEILQAERHQFLSQWDVLPLLALDVWEHAYYLQYLNEKATYVDRWWNVVDWREPEARLKQAQQVKWTPF